MCRQFLIYDREPILVVIVFICIMISSIHDFSNPFFIGIAGSGMSAIAQYLNGIGKNVTGSDRFFKEGEYNEIKESSKLKE